MAPICFLFLGAIAVSILVEQQVDGACNVFGFLGCTESLSRGQNSLIKNAKRVPEGIWLTNGLYMKQTCAGHVTMKKCLKKYGEGCLDMASKFIQVDTLTQSLNHICNETSKSKRVRYQKCYKKNLVKYKNCREKYFKSKSCSDINSFVWCMVDRTHHSCGRAAAVVAYRVLELLETLRYKNCKILQPDLSLMESPTEPPLKNKGKKTFGLRGRNLDNIGGLHTASPVHSATGHVHVPFWSLALFTAVVIQSVSYCGLLRGID